METLAKLTVNEANVDLLIATLAEGELSAFINQLIQLIPTSATPAAPSINYLSREYALIVLCALVNCDDRIGQILAEHPFGIEYLTMLLEEYDRNAKVNRMPGSIYTSRATEHPLYTIKLFL